VEVFEGAVAIEVERSRFLPVKTTNDLLVLRSDVYVVGEDYSLRLVDGRSNAPFVDLDKKFYALVSDFDQRFPAGPPSLAGADSLRVAGDWTFGAGVVVLGDVSVDAAGSPGRISDGTVLRGS
jgi:UTP--glucose-1-phosphate uridylyltransferase